LEVVTALVKHPKIRLNDQDKYGNTALYYAHENNETEIVNLLLGRGAKVIGGGAAVGGGSERPFGTLKL
jgi:ankyrin repeat protein